jgi:hypothetical protein
VSARQGKLRHVAGRLIVASVLTGVYAVAVRAGCGGLSASVFEGVTLFLASAAYLAHVVAHHEYAREMLTKSILASAFALWGDRADCTHDAGRRSPQRCRDRAVRD